jgi:hypothetical protein
VPRWWAPLSGRLDRLVVDGLRRPVGERDDRPERGATGPVGTARSGRDAVADAVEPGNGLVLAVEHLPFGAGARTALGVERAAGDRGRIVGPLGADRPRGRIPAPRLFLDRTVEQLLDLPLATVEALVLPAVANLLKRASVACRLGRKSGAKRNPPVCPW